MIFTVFREFAKYRQKAKDIILGGRLNDPDLKNIYNIDSYYINDSHLYPVHHLKCLDTS